MIQTPNVLKVAKIGKATYRASISRGPDTLFTSKGGIAEIACKLWEEGYMLPDAGKPSNDYTVIDQVVGTGADAILKPFKQVYEASVKQAENASLTELAALYSRDEPIPASTPHVTEGEKIRYALLMKFKDGLGQRSIDGICDSMAEGLRKLDMRVTDTVKYLKTTAFYVTTSLDLTILELKVNELKDKTTPYFQPDNVMLIIR